MGPAEFKQVLGEVAPQFAGYAQQDSMELFNFLMDNLHEDLNRIIDKPSVPPVEDGGRPDVEVAHESWDAFEMRNKSHVVDKMMGQFRSHLTCPNPACKNEARKFDEYMSVPLPVPGESSQEVEVEVFRRGAGLAGTKYTFPVPKGAMWKDVMKILCEKAGLNIETIACYDHYNGKVSKTLWTPNQKVLEKCKVGSYDRYRVYEMFDAPDAAAEAAGRVAVATSSCAEVCEGETKKAATKKKGTTVKKKKKAKKKKAKAKKSGSGGPTDKGAKTEL